MSSVEAAGWAMGVEYDHGPMMLMVSYCLYQTEEVENAKKSKNRMSLLESMLLRKFERRTGRCRSETLSDSGYQEGVWRENQSNAAREVVGGGAMRRRTRGPLCLPGSCESIGGVRVDSLSRSTLEMVSAFLR